MDAPKPTFADIARGATRGQTGEDDGRRRKRIAEEEPKAAKVSRSNLRWGAIQNAIANLRFVGGM